MLLWRYGNIAVEARRLLWAVFVSGGAHVAACLGLALITFEFSEPGSSRDHLAGEVLAASTSDPACEADQPEVLVSTAVDHSSALNAKGLEAPAASHGGIESPVGPALQLAARALAPRSKASESPFDGRGGDWAREIAPAKKSRPGSSGFFGLQVPGKKYVYVVDNSGSMHGHRFRRARRELRVSLESLEPSQQFFIVFYNHVALPMPATGLLDATPANVAATLHWLKQVECDGGTNPLPGLLIALSLKPDVIYMMTDGKFGQGVVWGVQQAETRPYIPIYTIGFASRAGEPLLRQIADYTGGTYKFVR